MASSLSWTAFFLVAIVGAASAGTTLPTENGTSPILPALFQQEYTSKPIRILAVFPLKGFSHHIMTENLMRELARRGHHVTLASPFPPKEAVPPTYVHVDISDIIPKTPKGAFNFESLAQVYGNKHVYTATSLLAGMDGHKLCQDVFNHVKIKQLLTSPSKFDVFFSEVFGAGCCFAIGTKLQVPTIAIATSPAYQWMEEFNGDNHNPSFTESKFLTPTKEGLSSFVQRFKNTYYYLLTKYCYYETMTRPSEVVVQDFLGPDAPSMDVIRKNISLFMINTHESLFTAKPLVPRILPVGGLHLRPPNPKKLTADVKSWLDGAPNGVVYFSLGSFIRSDTIPENLMRAFTSAFRELKHLRFLWKFETTAQEAKAAGIPENVLIVEWLPQMEILSHPNVLAFITHGGLMGTYEAVYYGVPMIGMPVFADQVLNVARYEKLGIGVSLDYRTVTKENIVEAVTKVISDPSFRQRMKEVSQVFRDRLMSPLDSAIWWTEYIARNKGAPHLESPVATIPFWQYALLDVAGVALVGISISLFIVYSVIRIVFRFLMRQSAQKEHKKTN